MKKLAFLALLSAISAPTITTADPVNFTLDITCPSAVGDTNVLSNFGGYIAGYGTESIRDREITPIYFKSTEADLNVPVKLNFYTNEMTDYNSALGQVTCSYVSSEPNEPRFAVSYTLTNGKGGVIVKQSNQSLSIKVLFGLKA